MGKLIAEARAEVALLADILDYYASRAEAYLKVAPVGGPGNSVETLPLGVILGVEPWNFPHYQLARVVGPQLMVGNVVIIKHAGNVPQCAHVELARPRRRAHCTPPLMISQGAPLNANRLGEALLMCPMRHLGRVLEIGEVPPASIVFHFVRQIGIDPAVS